MNQSQFQQTHRARAASLMCGASVALVASLMSVSATAAAAKADTEVSEVVVTGTSIRGQAPVGSSVVSVGQDSIQKTSAQTVQQILRSVPSVVGMGAVGQGSFGSADGAGTNAPTIHGLGASASNSTLILIDGHRIPLSGINHALADPNVLAPLALQRVEVLADGASSVYGSDAVAGVINFITRKNFDGLEMNAQTGFADSYHTFTAGVVGGKSWEDGGVTVAYGYSDRSNLRTGNRSFTHADHRSQGGSNLASFACGPATISPAGQALIFASPYNTPGLVNSAVNAPCDYTGLADLIPSEKRHSLFVSVHQNLTDKLSINGDVVYSKRNNSQANVRGTVTATVFGPGAASASQINPFYTLPTGVAGTSQTVRFDANSLLGPGAHTDSGEEAFFVAGGADYRFNDDWNLNVGGVVGKTDSRQQVIGVLCGSCANLALNGTTNGGGSLTSVSVPGTTTIILGTPLTAANALDVWNSGSANRTSAAVLRALTDSTTTSLAHQTLVDTTVKLDGKLFDLPGGAVKVAVGAEVIKYKMSQDITRPLGTGPATTGSATVNLNYDRDVKSAFAEFLLPLVGPDQNVPLIRRLDLNVSGRYDDYSDFGETKNPKVGINWEVIEGLTFRANYAKSFVAPAFTSRGNALGITGESGFGNYGLGTVNIPLSAYPTAATLPGCSATAVTCTIGNSAVTGVQITGGNKDLKPQTGKSWAIGADWNPSFVEGLRLSVTYWNNELNGAITAPQPAFAVNSAGLNSLLTIFPNGATAAELAALTGTLPQTSALSPKTYFVYSFQQRNALNLLVQGVDLSANYSFNTDLGRFTVDAIASEKTKFRQQVGTGGATFDVLGTTGFNTTFPSIKMESRVGLTWKSTFGLSADAFWNHTAAYKNWSGTTVTPIIRSAAGVPTGGGDKVDANNTFDLHVAYDMDGEGITKGVQLYLDVNNVTDKEPPFYNNTAGYDTFSGNPLGRVTSIGARKKF